MVFQESVFIITCSEKCILKGTVSAYSRQEVAKSNSLNSSKQKSYKLNVHSSTLRLSDT